MLKLITFPNTILTERMPEFDFENPVMDPKELEKEIEELKDEGVEVLSIPWITEDH